MKIENFQGPEKFARQASEASFANRANFWDTGNSKNFLVCQNTEKFALQIFGVLKIS